MTVRIASCACGQLTVACRGEPTRVSICHCLDCQKRTGSAYGVQARFAEDEVRVGGVSKQFERTGESGGRVMMHFCPVCGSTVYWRIEALPGWVAVAVGAFADPDFPMPTVEVYEDRAHPWARPVLERLKRE